MTYAITRDRWFGRALGRSAVAERRNRRRLRPVVLPLEDRRLLSTFTVMNTNSSGTGSLAQAISDANGNNQANTIQFSATVFSTPQKITLGGSALVLSDTGGLQTITGPTSGVTISGGGQSHVFEIDQSVQASLSGLTITDGFISSSYSVDGVGVSNRGTITLDDCTISGNTGVRSFGGGLYNGRGATATLDDCTISGNSAIGGGGVVNDGTAMISGCTISGNSAGDAGGAVKNFYSGTIDLDNCTISGNSAGTGGVDNYGTTTLNDCTITGNSAGIDGGGVHNGSGTATLNDTIVAGNTHAGAPNDIVGNVSGSYNLIGTGGSGGLVNGQDDNQVGVADPLLGTLGFYGGPTETIPLLPGSPAISAGTTVDYPGTSTPIATDQRGVARPGSDPDIGAFQSQGFTLTPVSGSTPQSATVNTPFTNPLAVTVMAHDSLEPVAGGVITFNVPSSGASASLSAATATIASNDQASVTADANAIAGSYTVTASAGGANPAANFSLTNTTIQPVFSNLAGPTIVYGHPAVTLSGFILAGSTSPRGNVAITLDGVTQQARIAANGSFSSSFNTASLSVAGSPYTITYAYAAKGEFAGVTNSTKTLTITQATPTVHVSDAGGIYTGNPYAATVTVTGVSGTPSSSLEDVTPILTYYDGTTASGTPLPGAPTGAGTYTVLASFAGSTDYKPASATATFSITQTAVTGFAVSWGTTGSAALNLPATTGGLLLPAGRTTDLPWLGIDQINLTLGVAENLTASDVSISSAIGVKYGPVTLTESGTTLTIKLAGAIDQADRVTITIGNAGVASFSGQLAVLPGDVNDDGVVNVQDLVAVEQRWLGAVTPTMFGDITGDGTPSEADYLAVRQRIGTKLPSPTS